ncbi:phasin, PhaP [Maritimibacter sp. 55A14]|uniref:phasin family protein n=1 Tax=Maritimibacter sp. 55A14 TaxID=2174844 RepID=UPI000D6046D9|nr:phasin family protein [Maritimibacter sp. 55A14]PWE32006.1 phasin, PhaP [Maritimibacter sp. 55A14]
MTKATDYTKAFSDMMSTFPADFSVYQDAMQNSAALGEKLAKVALTAAEQSADISSKWTKDTLGKMGAVAKVQKDPADYSKVATDFASASVEMTTENLAAFAEVAKRAQMEAFELLMASGKDATEEMTAAMKKATTDATAATKKAAKAA